VYPSGSPTILAGDVAMLPLTVFNARQRALNTTEQRILERLSLEFISELNSDEVSVRQVRVSLTNEGDDVRLLQNADVYDDENNLSLIYYIDCTRKIEACVFIVKEYVLKHFDEFENFIKSEEKLSGTEGTYFFEAHLSSIIFPSTTPSMIPTQKESEIGIGVVAGVAAAAGAASAAAASSSSSSSEEGGGADLDTPGANEELAANEGGDDVRCLKEGDGEKGKVNVQPENPDSSGMVDKFSIAEGALEDGWDNAGKTKKDIPVAKEELASTNKRSSKEMFRRIKTMTVFCLKKSRSLAYSSV